MFLLWGAPNFAAMFSDSEPASLEQANSESTADDSPEVQEAKCDQTFKTTINDLPELPLLLIMDRVRLYDLLMHVDEVSARWARLQAKACRARHSLTLLLGTGAEKLLLSFLYKSDYNNGLEHQQLSG